jgi:hypothetical protein
LTALGITSNPRFKTQSFFFSQIAIHPSKRCLEESQQLPPRRFCWLQQQPRLLSLATSEEKWACLVLEQAC